MKSQWETPMEIPKKTCRNPHEIPVDQPIFQIFDREAFSFHHVWWLILLPNVQYAHSFIVFPLPSG